MIKTHIYEVKTQISTDISTDVFNMTDIQYFTNYDAALTYKAMQYSDTFCLENGEKEEWDIEEESVNDMYMINATKGMMINIRICELCAYDSVESLIEDTKISHELTHI